MAVADGFLRRGVAVGVTGMVVQVCDLRETIPARTRFLRLLEVVYYF